MTWEPELDELRRREAFAEALGGPDKVERQHSFGKLTIRERIDAMADAGSFHEIGKTAGVAEYDDDGELVHLTPSNFVFGTARIDDRPVVLSGDDFTVRGGSADATIPEKRNTAESIALDRRWACGGLLRFSRSLTACPSPPPCCPATAGRRAGDWTPTPRYPLRPVPPWR